MREIKFRAWDPINKRIISSVGFTDSGRKYMMMGESAVDLRQEWIPMQYTGLKDQNGKKIYEGDILEDGKKQRGRVLWHHNSYLVEWQERGHDGHLLQDRMTDDCFGYGEIIGNIYENPDLLP